MAKLAYALIIGDRKVVLWNRFGNWSLPCTTIEDSTQEQQQAMIRLRQSGVEVVGGDKLHAHEVMPHYVAEHTDLCLTINEQLGPTYSVGEDTATAHLYHIEVQSGASPVQYEWFTAEMLREITLPDPQHRMAWDALSVQEDPIVGPNELDEPVEECIFLSDDGLYLVAEFVDGQKKWPRLEMRSP